MFGQKDEIKSAEKSIKSNDFNTAITTINQAESLISSADDKMKAKFYYLKGIALYQNGGPQMDIDKTAAAFNELINFEKSINSYKYSDEVKGLVNTMVNGLASNASKDYSTAIETKEPSDFLKAAKQFHQVYMLSKTDTVFLDNAALVYYFAKDYATSRDLYKQLLDLNYTGIAQEFIATNKADGQDVSYPDKKAMDLQVKLGIVENPRVELKESRRELIFKNIAQNYSDLEEMDKALEYIAKGRAEFPESYSLLIDEANIYYKLGDNAKFKERLEMAIEMNPTEPTLYYNVGVMNMDQKKIDEAIKYFEKAIELNPKYGDAYNNIGAAIIDRAAPIIEEMNKSLSDFSKYDKLQKKQFEIYEKAVPYYEKAFELNKSSISVVQTLMGLYENLGMSEKLEAMQAVYAELKGE
ncbi:tetratricopeptide repeat protein [Lutibacter sp.]|uniref:tetratricopeptide repeat protein n=1 Tax=Lutibacter sp. TaxID=1925666 RepID=UPI001A1EED9E|nr:tetratricopeptide repeat protein [Lutibacter sp.]MBI9042069.1 tetratricopeptide repeat protein [Lutibacter sp.]